MTRIYASSGGGIRIGGTFGALLEGEHQQRFSPHGYDYYVGTSAGALDAALTANGWSAEQKCQMFINTRFADFFTPGWLPFELRKAFAIRWPMSLKKIERFYASLCQENPYGPALTFQKGLLINTVDSEENLAVVYCSELPDWAHVETDPKNGKLYTYRTTFVGERKKLVRWEVGTTPLSVALMRSAVLPGLVGDDIRYMDGGISENPLLSILPTDADILLMHLGYAGLVPNKGNTVPKSLLERFLYAFEFKAYSFTEHILERFQSLTMVFPKILDVDTAAFHLSKTQKQQMLLAARGNTKEQWKALPKIASNNRNASPTFEKAFTRNLAELVAS